MAANANSPGRRKWLSGEAIGGYATALAVVISIFTFVWTDHSQNQLSKQQIDFNKEQSKFNSDQLDLMNKGLALQRTTADEQGRAATALKEAAAVAAMGRYLTTPGDNVAWESAEAIIDLVGKDEAWQATARRALYHHPANLQHLECALYSQAFKDFVLKQTLENTTEYDLCSGRAHFKPLSHSS